MRKLQRQAIRALGCLHCKSTDPQAQKVPSLCSGRGCTSGHVGRKPRAHILTTCHSRCRRYVDGRAQHTRRILVQLCKHVENPMSSSLLACRETTSTELLVKACITRACSTLFRRANSGRKSNVCVHINWGVPIKVSMSVNNAPWCVAHK
jgi:hypothetical protein